MPAGHFLYWYRSTNTDYTEGHALTQTGCQPGWPPKNDDKTCEFVFGVRLTFANKEQYAGSKIVWTVSPAAPVSEATGAQFTCFTGTKVQIL